MVNVKPSRTAAVPGNREPSPSKSRLPVGPTVPQRNTSMKVLQNTAPQLVVRRSSTRVARAVSKPTTTASSQSTSSRQAENHPSQHPRRPQAKSSVIPPHGSAAQTVHGKPAALVTTVETANPIDNLSCSRETLEDRLEILHLSTMHSRAAETQQKWTDDASEFYQRQFRALQSRQTDIRQRENDRSVQQNASSIMSWSSSDICLSKKIQDLSAVIHDMDQLTSIRGRYNLVIQAFEHWAASNGVFSGSTTKKRGRPHTKKIECLGDGWVREVEALQTQMVSNAEKMLALGDVKPIGSELQRTVALVEEMLRNMLEELETMMELESLTRHTMLSREDDDSIAAMTREFSHGLHLA